MQQDTECILCRISGGEEPSQVILDSENYLAVYNDFTRYNYDVIILPKEHINQIKNISNISNYFKFILDVLVVLLDTINYDSVKIEFKNRREYNNIITHTYCHIIPNH